LQAPKATTHQLFEYQFRSIAVLYSGAVDHHNQNQPEGVYDQVALATLDLLARIVAATEPPF
jgi:hypothetical protein